MVPPCWHVDAPWVRLFYCIPAWMHQHSYIPCGCKKCFFCKANLTTGITHKPVTSSRHSTHTHHCCNIVQFGNESMTRTKIVRFATKMQKRTTGVVLQVENVTSSCKVSANTELWGVHFVTQLYVKSTTTMGHSPTILRTTNSFIYVRYIFVIILWF